MFPGPTELRLIGYSIELTWTQKKIQIKYIDTKNQLADILTKGNFTRDECNHLLCLFNITHFSFTVCSEGMAKRTQQDSGEERVTAKSRPMMSLVGRDPSTLSSSASERPGKKINESQSPWSAKAEKDDRTEQPVVTSWGETRVPNKFLSWEDPARYCGRGRTCTGCVPSKRSKATAIHHWKPRNRIRIFVGIQIILEQGEWSKNDPQWMLQKTEKTLFCMENVHVCNNGISSVHGERVTWTIVIPSRIQKTSHWNKCSTKQQDLCQNKMRSLEWKQSVGKTTIHH